MIKLPEKPKTILKRDNMAVFEIEGLYPGYGMTLGNALRRVLLSSLPGAAITMVKIKGVSHEFTTIPYVHEDVVDLILNLKQIRFKLHSEEPQKLYLRIKGEREIKASDIQTPSQVEVVNKDAHIATLTNKKADLDIEMQVERGWGYMPVESRKTEKLEVGNIAIDAFFTPIRKVNYEVENMRVGERTDYNRLRLHLETDGTISPEEALKQCSQILVGQFSAIEAGLEEKKPKAVKKQKETVGVKEEVNPVIEEMKLSTRTLNALSAAKLKDAEAIAKKTEKELKSVEGLGEKGMKEIKKALKKLGMELKF